MYKKEDFLHYYYLENYIFFNVSEKFSSNHRIDAFDFYCILVWCEDVDPKKIKKQLLKKSKRDKSIPKRFQNNFDFVVKKISRDLFNIEDDKGKLDYLYNEWKLPLELSFAILSVCYPDIYAVFNMEAADHLDKDEKTNHFTRLLKLTSFDNIWERYMEYIDKLNKNINSKKRLNDKVRWIQGKEFASEVKRAIKKK